MFFLRSVYLAATAALITFTSASPVHELGVNSEIQSLDTNAGSLVHRRLVNLDDVTIDSGVVKAHRNDVAEARESPQSLPGILLSVKVQLTDVKEQAVSFSQDGRESVNVDVIRPCFDKINGILVIALDNAKLLRGKPVDVILGGCTLLEIAELLCIVLTLIVDILLALIECAGPQSSNVIIDIVTTTVSGVLCNLLTLVLSLVDGLLVLLLPLLLGIIGSLASCGLGGVLKVLFHL